MIIAPSILSADFANMASELQQLEEAKADWIHVDVMDGHFVPNLTFGAPVIKKFRPHTDLPFDVHLMISNPEEYIEEYINAGANSLTIHYEAVDNPVDTLNKIRKLGIKAGISIKPNTPAEKIRPYLSLCDLILVMTVEPGFGGQTFMHNQLNKIKTIRNWLDEEKLSTILEVDGGITPETISLAAQAGATVFVAGSAVFNGDYANNIKALKKSINHS